MGEASLVSGPVVQPADAHALQRGWGSLHRQYPTVDITVDQLSCGAEIRATLATRLLPLFAERFGAQYGPASSLDFRDLFVAKYDADAADGQRGLDGHVDASMLSMVLQKFLFAPVSFLNRAMALMAAGCLVYPSSTSRLVGSLLAIALMFRNRQKAL